MITKEGNMLPKMRKQSAGPAMAALRAHEMKDMANVKVMPKVVPARDYRHASDHMDRVRA